MPALERGLLRSPELVLLGLLTRLLSLTLDIVPGLCMALCSEIDLSNGVSKTLLPQLISSIKSTKANIREASREGTVLLLSRCRNPEALKTIAETLIKTIKEGNTISFRVLRPRTIRRCTDCSNSSYRKSAEDIHISLLRRRILGHDLPKGNDRNGDDGNDRGLDDA